ncbi:NBS-LRR type disease resistance protein [Medicago truncatula]|uniref:NBS-LRR type disease resistance protein n=1 Tax=Medicago truncatula TaxID=3880 RepID=A0A072V6F3_MEDTR|nr:NBS-LRR type disease resistance protein [Medicago truncatula]
MNPIFEIRAHVVVICLKEVSLLKDVHNEFEDIKDELESIQAFLQDADKRAVAEGDNTSEGVKIWLKQVRKASFRIENIVDDYVIHVGQQPCDPGCVPFLYKLKTLTLRHQIAYEIRDIKSYVCRIKERSDKYGFQRSIEQGSNSSRKSQNSKWYDPRVAALYMQEDDIVGFKVPRRILISWMVKGREEGTIISVVGMGGQGKTTLAKRVSDNKDVIGHFNCLIWISVSII